MHPDDAQEIGARRRWTVLRNLGPVILGSGGYFTFFSAPQGPIVPWKDGRGGGGRPASSPVSCCA